MRLRGALARFLKDLRGVSAVEFALVAPALLAVYCGSTEVSSAMLNERRVSHAVSAIGDLASQNQQLTSRKVDDIFAAATIIMQPYSTAPLNLRLTSVTRNPAGADLVDWSRSQGTGLPPHAAGGHFPRADFPHGILENPGDTVIVAEGTYAYASPIAYTIPTRLNFSNINYFHPRFPTTLTCSGC